MLMKNDAISSLSKRMEPSSPSISHRNCRLPLEAGRPARKMALEMAPDLSSPVNAILSGASGLAVFPVGLLSSSKTVTVV